VCVCVCVCVYPFFSALEFPSLLDYFPNFSMKSSVEMVLILKKFTLYPYSLEKYFFVKGILIHLLKAIIYTKLSYKQ